MILHCISSTAVSMKTAIQKVCSANLMSLRIFLRTFFRWWAKRGGRHIDGSSLALHVAVTFRGKKCFYSPLYKSLFAIHRDLCAYRPIRYISLEYSTSRSQTVGSVSSIYPEISKSLINFRNDLFTESSI